jgi:hypothetical protein
VAAGALLADIVQQSLSDLPPDCFATVKTDRVDSLDFDDPLAAAAGNPKHVALDLGQPPLTGWGPLEAARGSCRTERQYSPGSGASGAVATTAGRRATSAASFSIGFGVGMRQLAGRSLISQ